MFVVFLIFFIGLSGVDLWFCLRFGWDKCFLFSVCFYLEERVKEKFFEYDGFLYYY